MERLAVGVNETRVGNLGGAPGRTMTHLMFNLPAL